MSKQIAGQITFEELEIMNLGEENVRRKANRRDKRESDLRRQREHQRTRFDDWE